MISLNDSYEAATGCSFMSKSCRLGEQQADASEVGTYSSGGKRCKCSRCHSLSKESDTAYNRLVEEKTKRCFSSATLENCSGTPSNSFKYDSHFERDEENPSVMARDA